MKTKKVYILILLLVFTTSVTPQKKEDIRYKIGSSYDIRDISKEFLGDPDMWLYILKYNNIQNLSDLKSGTTILIPQERVKRLLNKLEQANKSIQDAVLIGAKILAEDILKSATDYYSKAIQFKNTFDYDKSEKNADEVISAASRAYLQTKEIREKTIDAIISFKKGTVQKMFPTVIKWQDADLYDNLHENDWTRTLSLSLANITFYDLSQIKLNENSQAVIQSSKMDVIGNKTSTKVKLEKGNAYAMLLNSPKKKFDLDIKGVKTKINSKYFWVEKNNDNTKLSNYNGEIALQVKDSTVVVQKNQGSVIPDNSFPSPAKNLLPAPNLFSQENPTYSLFDKIKFSWTAVNSSYKYWMEISTDASFSKIYQSKNDILTNSVELSGFQPGVYYWHVCCIDNLGLPGPYSEYRTFIITPDNGKPFLTVVTPLNNFSCKENIVKVIGKTDPGCRVFLNQKEITNNKGDFDYNYQLIEGTNNVIIKSLGINGSESIVQRKIYYESDSDIKITDNNYGTLTDHKKILLNTPHLSLNLSTRPFSKIELTTLQSTLHKVDYSDSLGNCKFILQNITSSEKINIHIITAAGYEKSILVETGSPALLPHIVLDPLIESTTKSNEILLSGKVERVKNLFINDNQVKLEPDGRFSSLQNLKDQKNIFIFKAVDEFGNINVTEKSIFLDNKPPQLVSYKLNPSNNYPSLYTLVIKAEDETNLKKSVEVELIVDGNRIKEIFPFNNEKNIYEGDIICNKREKPVITKIILEDCLNNSKTYIINK